MDILRFINSKDIREHLESIHYQFNSLEAAWLICQCKTATIEDKHAAWQELIDTMPDCTLPERREKPPCDSLHQFLTAYMATERAIIDDLSVSEDNAVYTYDCFEDCSDGTSYWLPSCQYFSSHSACINDYIRQIQGREPPHKYRIEKHRLDNHEVTRVAFSPDHKPLDYDTSWYPGENGDAILYGVFGWLWFEFPTPFKKGDILCEYDAVGKETSGFCRGPFVVTGITPDHATESNRLYGDESDMNAWGYFQAEDGTIYEEVMSNYMDLEYYRGELTGKWRILKALSNHVKGNIDTALFANAYHHILCDEHAKAQRPRGYTDEGLRLAGLLK